MNLLKLTLMGYKVILQPIEDNMVEIEINKRTTGPRIISMKVRIPNEIIENCLIDEVMFNRLIEHILIKLDKLEKS